MLVLAFKVDLYYVNVDNAAGWVQHFLPQIKNLRLSKSCQGGRCNAKKWSDFRVGVSDDVRVSSPSAWESSVYMC